MTFGLLIKHMKYREFNTLTDLDRADAAWTKGVLLAERREAFHKMMLYQLDDFYIEVTYHTHFNVVLKVQSFKDPRFLEPYLQAIDISQFLA
jgi:hypothetical protein